CESAVPGILGCSAVAFCTSPFFTSKVSSVMTFAGFSAFFFCARARRAASATESWDCANAAAESSAEARIKEKARRKEKKHDIMKLLMEGGMGTRATLKVRG